GLLACYYQSRRRHSRCSGDWSSDVCSSDLAGHVVTRRALREKLWPDTVVAYEHGLNTAVNNLRDLLGDSARSPRFVETLPRRGYRFIAPVTKPEKALANESPSA